MREKKRVRERERGREKEREKMSIRRRDEKYLKKKVLVQKY